MNTKFIILIPTFLLLLSGSIDSQTTYTSQLKPLDWKCGANILLQNNVSNDAGVETAFDNYNDEIDRIINSNNAINTPTAPYTIPVVFHIIQDANNSTPIPTYAQIQWQLASLNAAFSNSLNSLNSVPNGTHAVNTQIQFCFAKNVQSSSGPGPWFTPNFGMALHTTTNTALISNIVLNNTLSLQALAAITNYTLFYPPNEYLNIFCVPNITNLLTGYSVFDPPSIIGIGTFPWMSLPIDGVIMRNDCIGNNTYNNFNMFGPLDKGNILAHEVAHYLGVFHTFETITTGLGSANGSVGCYGTNSITAYTQGDLVFDTPPTQINNSIGPGPINTCAETYSPYVQASDENDQLENFMTYSDDDMMNTFTLNQAGRMWAALDASQPPASYLSAQRSNLVTASNLTLTGVTDSPSCGPCIFTSAFTSSILPATITCSTVAYKFNTPVLPTYLCSNSYTWNFGDGGTSNSANPIHTFTNTALTFTVQLTVVSGTAASTHSTIVNIPNGFPKIVGQSGNSFPVCRGTEQSILIQFPAYATSAVITDGTNYYTVNNNAPHTCISPAGVYEYPFLFTINNNVSFSMVPANCGTLSTGIASFTVVDCCSNLVNNGDFESGVTGYYSNYVLTPSVVSSGSAAINFPNVAPLGNSGKVFIVDSHAWNTLTTCTSPGTSSILIGQGITGLKPSTNYYISFKCIQGHDSIAIACGSAKFNIKLYSPTSVITLSQNIVPSSIPHSGSSGCLAPGFVSGNILGALEVFNFTVTTPSTITISTSFSLEISEVDHFGANGFDYLFDNIILSEMNPPILITPLSSTICPGSTVQITASNNCVNINNYSLSWYPSSSLSCSTCANPIASPSITTVYTLIAIPPISSPPLPNIVLPFTVNVASLSIIAQSSPSAACFPSATFTLLAGGGATSATWQPGNQNTMSITVSPTVSSIYTLTSISGSCQQTNTLLIGPFSINTASSVTHCANLGVTTTLTSSSPNSAWATYTWQPGNLIGSTQTVTPSTNTTYTVFSSLGSCTTSAIASLTVINNCCPTNSTTYAQTTMTSNTTFAGPMVISSDFTVQSGVTLYLIDELIFAHNAKITVGNNASLYIQGAHLYSCGNEMWQGIVVKDGGYVNGQYNISSNKANLIEDAITAISVSNHTNSTLTSILDLNNTIFNKNYIDINISNYQRSSSTYDNSFLIHSCVFTCRDLLPTSSSWPQAGTTSSLTGTSADLRYASATATAGLSAPYLTQTGFTYTNLKVPYSTQKSHIAIQINSVGINSSSVMYAATIGSTMNPSYFNLFDAHGSFIVSNQSNLSLYNNVFQNTQTYTIASGTTTITYGGSAITQSVSNTLNTALLLNSTSKDLGNRFWDCHKAIDGKNMYRFWMANSIIRSSQSSASNSTLTLPGNTGIGILTNRFQYYIVDNDFENIKNATNIVIAAASYTPFCFNCSGNGVYAHTIRIVHNTFSAGTNTNCFMDQAIIIQGPNTGSWAGPTSNSVPFSLGISIDNNTLTAVNRGIYLNGNGAGFPSKMESNVITLKDDNSSSQRGISVENTYGKCYVIKNRLSALSTTNTSQSLFYFSINYGLISPSVTCNTATNCNKGFEFNSTNGIATTPSLCTYWRGNEMENLSKGMVLTGTAVIGPQGNTGFPIDNQWKGSWPNGTYGVYNDNTSNAADSRLTVKTGTPWAIPTYTGGSLNLSQNYGAPGTIYTTTLGDYYCGDFSTNRTISTQTFSTVEALYISNTALYRYLYFNDSLRNSNPDLVYFFDSKIDSSYDVFMQIEDKLYQGYLAEASTIISNVDEDDFNAVEINYLHYYSLYLKFAENNFEKTTADDSLTLLELANLCPANNGACVLQARALYSFVFKTTYIYSDNCDDASGARIRKLDSVENEYLVIKNWDIDIFPNPASDQITLQSAKENEILLVTIKDLSNRVVLMDNFKTNNFRTNFDIKLLSGLYLITIRNKANQSITKKLVISK